MKRAQPLLPMDGVPNELIEALNARFREVGAQRSAAPSIAGKAAKASLPVVFPSAAILRVALVHSADTTVTSPTAIADGDLLTVLLVQPSNADGRVLWDSGFSADTPTAIDTTTNDSITRVQFVWSATDSKWIFLAMNAGGSI